MNALVVAKRAGDYFATASVLIIIAIVVHGLIQIGGGASPQSAVQKTWGWILETQKLPQLQIGVLLLIAVTAVYLVYERVAGFAGRWLVNTLWVYVGAYVFATLWDAAKTQTFIADVALANWKYVLGLPGMVLATLVLGAATTFVCTKR